MPLYRSRGIDHLKTSKETLEESNTRSLVFPLPFPLTVPEEEAGLVEGEGATQEGPDAIVPRPFDQSDNLAMALEAACSGISNLSLEGKLDVPRASFML